MAELIEFPGGRQSGEDDRERHTDQAQNLEAIVVAFLAAAPETLRRRVLGEGLQGEQDLGRIERFFYSHLINRFRRVSEAFLSYLYLSRLATRADLVPGYVTDLIHRQAPTVAVGDLCFALAAFYPEWVERRGSAMRVRDYVRIGACAYQTVSAQLPPPRNRMFADLAERFAEYAEAVAEARKALSG